MAHSITRASDIPRVGKYDMRIDVYPNIAKCGMITASTDVGHNQEFYHKTSTFHYIILEGGGSFFLNDEEVPVHTGDLLSVEPNTRIYYKGKMRLVLITDPAWKEEDEVETRAKIW